MTKSEINEILEEIKNTRIDDFKRATYERDEELKDRAERSLLGLINLAIGAGLCEEHPMPECEGHSCH